MADISTLERASNPQPEEGLVSIFEERSPSPSLAYLGGRNSTLHIQSDSFGSQSILFPMSRSDNYWSHYGSGKPLFPVGRGFASTGTVAIPWRQILHAWSFLQRRLVTESNRGLIWQDTYEPVHGGVTRAELAEILEDLEVIQQLMKPAMRPSPEFAEILTDLAGTIEEAQELGYPTPSPLAVSNARLLLQRLYLNAPQRFEVYPTPDAEIAIDAPGEGGSLVVLCDSNGGAFCMANLPDGHHTKFYSTTDTLPDGFVSEALAMLVSDSN